jgi:hypothetical protein
MAKFNLSNLSSVDEYNARLKDVYDFMNRGSKDQDNSVNTNLGTRRAASTTDVKSEDPLALDAAEKKFIADSGWTTERFLKLKEKMPDYVQSQIDLIR